MASVRRMAGTVFIKKSSRFGWRREDGAEPFKSGTMSGDKAAFLEARVKKYAAGFEHFKDTGLRGNPRVLSGLGGFLRPWQNFPGKCGSLTGGIFRLGMRAHGFTAQF